MENIAKIDPQDDLHTSDAIRRSSSAKLGLSALLAGVLALGLAVLPGIVLNKPYKPELPPPLADAPADPEDEVELESADEEGFVLKFKKFTLSLRSADDNPDEEKIKPDEDADDEHLIVQLDAKPAIEADPWPPRFAFASAGFALLGLLLGPIAWARERHPAMAGCAMAISGVALLWHYIVAAIIVGVVIIVILLFLRSLC